MKFDPEVPKQMVASKLIKQNERKSYTITNHTKLHPLHILPSCQYSHVTKNRNKYPVITITTTYFRQFTLHFFSFPLKKVYSHKSPKNKHKAPLNNN